MSQILKVDQAHVAPYVAEKLMLIDSVNLDISKFRDDFLPFLQHQMEITVCYFYIDKDGNEFWVARDGRPHPVFEYEDGVGQYIYGGEKRPIYK